MFTRIRYCTCIANVSWENKCTLMFASVQSKGREEESNRSWKRFNESPRLNESLNFMCFSPALCLSCDVWTLKAHSVFVYRASWMYILYIVDLPNLCSVSQIMLFLVVWDSLLATRTFSKSICPCSNRCLFIRQVPLCLLVFSVSFFSSSVQN